MNKNIFLLSTGGTIASTQSVDNRSKAGELTGQELIAKLELPHNIKIETESVFQKPSNALTFSDVLQLREKILLIDKQGTHSGIVITHGTDTLEDTAFFLQASLPAINTVVIITGSQRAPHLAGTDAYSNLIAAIKAASSSKLKGLGILVVFNDSIFSANHLRKTNSLQVNGFDAPGYGHLGYVSEDNIHILQRPLLPEPIVPTVELSRVDIITACLEASPEQLICSAESGAQGIILEGIGKGHVLPNWVPVVEQLIHKGIKFAVVTGSLMGSIEPTYDFDGCLKDLLDLGVIPINDMSARKARIRLMLAIASDDPEQALARLALTSNQY